MRNLIEQSKDDKMFHTEPHGVSPEFYDPDSFHIA